MLAVSVVVAGGTSKFDSLPVEIVSSIFDHCLSADWYVRQPDISQAPILLCHVCSRWRRIALTTAKLWCKLQVKITVVTFTQWSAGGRPVVYGRFVAQKNLDFLAWWGGNIANQPFSLILERPFEKQSSYRRNRYQLETTFHYAAAIESNRYDRFLARSIVHAAQNLNLSLLEDDLHILCSTAVDFQNLEYLTIQTSFSFVANPTQPIRFPSAPRLRRLYLSSFCVLPLFPCAQITHLCITSPTPPATLRSLLTRCCQNLRFGAFRLTDSIDASQIGEASNRVPNLCQLVVHGNTMADLLLLFKGLSFPSLSAVRLQLDSGQPHGFDVAVLLDVLRATPNVVEIRLGVRLHTAGTWAEHHSDSRLLPLNTSLPNLKNIVLEAMDAMTKPSIANLKNLMHSSLSHLASATSSSKVEIVFNKPLSGLFDNRTEPQDVLFENLRKYIDSNRHSLDYDIMLRRSIYSRWAWSQLSKDLSRWEEAMGFYDTVPS